MVPAVSSIVIERAKAERGKDKDAARLKLDLAET
jgi:hypothetical protein